MVPTTRVNMNITNSRDAPRPMGKDSDVLRAIQIVQEYLQVNGMTKNLTATINEYLYQQMAPVTVAMHNRKRLMTDTAESAAARKRTKTDTATSSSSSSDSLPAHHEHSTCPVCLEVVEDRDVFKGITRKLMVEEKKGAKSKTVGHTKRNGKDEKTVVAANTVAGAIQKKEYEPCCTAEFHLDCLKATMTNLASQCPACRKELAYGAGYNVCVAFKHRKQRPVVDAGTFMASAVALDDDDDSADGDGDDPLHAVDRILGEREREGQHEFKVRWEDGDVNWQSVDHFRFSPQAILRWRDRMMEREIKRAQAECQVELIRQQRQYERTIERLRLDLTQLRSALSGFLDPTASATRRRTRIDSGSGSASGSSADEHKGDKKEAERKP